MIDPANDYSIELNWTRYGRDEGIPAHEENDLPTHESAKANYSTRWQPLFPFPDHPVRNVRHFFAGRAGPKHRMKGSMPDGPPEDFSSDTGMELEADRRLPALIETTFNWSVVLKFDQEEGKWQPQLG